MELYKDIRQQLCDYFNLNLRFHIYVERTRPEELDVHQSYKSSRLVLETAKMHSLNKFNLKKMCSEKEEKSNMPSTNSSLPLDDRTAIRFMMKKTEKFNYSMGENDAEEAEQNHFEDKQMNGVQDEEINNVSSSLCCLLYKTIIQDPENEKNIPEDQENTPEDQENTQENQENIPENQKNTSEKKSESDFVFLKPKVYYCNYCNKSFFHAASYRRHMILHLKKLRWCRKCKRGFVSQAWFKKHRSVCYKFIKKSVK